MRTIIGRHPYILRAELFGSRSRGEATEASDLDLLVSFDPETRPKGVELYAAELELENALDLPVEVVQEKLSRDHVRQAIEGERELVHEKGK